MDDEIENNTDITHDNNLKTDGNSSINTDSSPGTNSDTYSEENTTEPHIIPMDINQTKPIVHDISTA